MTPSTTSPMLARLYAWLPVLEPAARRRRRLMDLPFPPAWEAILRQQAPFWSRLTDAHRSAIEVAGEFDVAQTGLEAVADTQRAERIGLREPRTPQGASMPPRSCGLIVQRGSASSKPLGLVVISED